jgi:nitrate/nitrite transport system permease protein
MNAMLKPTAPNLSPLPLTPPCASRAHACTPPAPPARRQRHGARARAQVSATALKIIAPLMGAALLVLVWQIITMKNSTFPTPAATLEEAVKLFSDPFYRNSPNDQGIGWNVLASCSAWAWASAWRRWWAFRWAS